VKANWLAFEKGKAGEVYNVCSGTPTKIRDALEMLIDFSGMEIKVNERVQEKMRFKDEPIILGDLAKIKSETGYEPDHEIGETLNDMLDYWVGYYSSKDRETYSRNYF
jgi:GDP-4-dehydro-6-deoxy-D-mannose reductase